MVIYIGIEFKNKYAGVAELAEFLLSAAGGRYSEVKIAPRSKSLISGYRKPYRGARMPKQSYKYAGVAELADAPDLGSGGTPVQVQVLSPVPYAGVTQW